MNCPGDAPIQHDRIKYTYTYTCACAFVMVRWTGGRSVAQLTTVEFLLVIALGSAVGDPMSYPEVPLLHALATVTVIVLINKLLDVIALRSDYFALLPAVAHLTTASLPTVSGSKQMTTENPGGK